jgi:5'-deoxynucleotidase YfbR-like HD superfamily hydrolase
MDAQSAPGGATDREVGDMSVPLEQMLEELRKAEQAQALMSEVERRLSAGNTDLQNLLRQLEQLGQSLAESDPIRLLIEEAVGAARTRDSIKAGSDVSRSRSAIEGEISSLRGAIQGVQARPDL